MSNTLARILLIDDEQDIRETISEFLRFSNFEVLTAENGIRGLELIAEHRTVDLILVDVSMPKMNGIEFVQEYLSRMLFLYAPIVMLTGHSESDQIVEALRMGADDFISKPFSMLDLVERLLKLIEVGRRRREQYKIVMSTGGEKAEKYLHYEKMNTLFRLSNNWEVKRRKMRA